MSQQISFEKLNNTRDLGGTPTTDGHIIRPGMLLRSGSLFGASENDLAMLAGAVSRIIDLRTGAETAEKPDPSISGAENIHLPIVDEIVAGVTREKEADETAMERFIQNPEMARQHMCGIYTAFIENEFSVGQYAAFVRLLLQPVAGATLWHCTAGKDRAGFAAMIVEEMLGVDRDLVVEDYLQTNLYLLGEVEALSEMIERRSGVPKETARESIGYLYGARREYIDILYRRIAEHFGDFEGFIENGLHIGGAEREAFRKLYLVKPAW